MQTGKVSSSCPHPHIYAWMTARDTQYHKFLLALIEEQIPTIIWKSIEIYIKERIHINENIYKMAMLEF